MLDHMVVVHTGSMLVAYAYHVQEPSINHCLKPSVVNHCLKPSLSSAQKGGFSKSGLSKSRAKPGMWRVIYHAMDVLCSAFSEC